jgi:hypothetical protein
MMVAEAKASEAKPASTFGYHALGSVDEVDSQIG